MDFQMKGFVLSKALKGLFAKNEMSFFILKE
jgi:hypothetical protein